jgi:16S rRNA (cytidine1402-2'-O)-methyltransferase
MNGILYIVSTPIGNMQDISRRAVETLSSVQGVLCEDTRRAGLLFQNLGIDKKPRFISYYEENELARIPEVISFLKDGGSLALISDAGTPLISDPGFKLVRECVANDIKVEAIPGPTALIAALSVSGLPTDKFLFLGFLPRKQGHRVQLLEKTKEALELVKSTVVFYEAPHRLIAVLEDLKSVFGDIEIMIARELTKTHEEVRHEKVSGSIEHFGKTTPKGEFVILFNTNE